MTAPDDMGLIADKAITGLGTAAAMAEQIAFRMDDGRDRDELVWLVEHMRDEEARLRADCGVGEGGALRKVSAIWFARGSGIAASHLAQLVDLLDLGRNEFVGLALMRGSKNSPSHCRY